MLKTTIRGYRAVIGLTGGIGSGKSHARECLASFGAITLDADSLAHETYKSGVTAFKDIVSTFGAGILNPSGTRTVH
jgi:dephospho-CoA kinase